MLVNLKYYTIKSLKQKLQEHYKEYAFFAEMEGRSKCFLTSWWNMKNGTQKRKLTRIEDEAKRIVVAVAKKKNGLKCISLWRGKGCKNTEAVKLVSAFKNHNSYYSADLIFAFKIFAVHFLCRAKIKNFAHIAFLDLANWKIVLSKKKFPQSGFQSILDMIFY